MLSHETTTTAETASVCPECEGAIPFNQTPMRAQIVTCRECGAELEVTGTEPIVLELAPEVEEDWGE